MHIEHNRSLKSLTTFKIGGPAREFVEITHPHELPQAFEYAEQQKLPVLVLGGGSNMLVSDRGFDGLVVHINKRGIERNGNMLRVAAGEVWDQVVKYTVDHSLWGVENLSRIPGRAGAVPVQNVGAYGQEAMNVIVNVEVYDREQKEFRTLSNAECEFTYRKSIFNTTEKGRYVILSMTMQLSEEPHRNLSYPDVQKWFENNPEPTQQEIRDAIKAIRDKKFPFPAESVEGNAGSFFKNSEITEAQFDDVRAHFERNFPEHLDRLMAMWQRTFRSAEPTEAKASLPHTGKMASAFILEVCGLKGYRKGDVQLNPTQPVIVLNVTGTASAAEVLSLVKEVRSIVQEKAGLHLYTEPELIGFSDSELRNFGFNAEEIERYVG